MTILTEQQVSAAIDAAAAVFTAAAAELRAQSASIQSLQNTVDSLLAAPPPPAISQALSDAVTRMVAASGEVAALLT